jgi:uncharacterized membrane protein
MISTWALSDDLSRQLIALVVGLFLLSVVLLLVELRKKRRASTLVFVTGIVAGLAVALSVLRPVSVRAKVSELGPRLVVLVDASRRMLLPSGDGAKSRADVAKDVVESLKQHYRDARVSTFSFADGPLAPWPGPASESADSDVARAFEQLLKTPGERPASVVVVSDGRLFRPGEGSTVDSLHGTFPDLGVPVHTVAVSKKVPRDASIRAVNAAGAAVAHQPLVLSVEVGCEGLSCGSIPVSVRELLRDESPVVLAQGTADASSGKATIELEITLDRAGTRVVEVQLDAPEGDELPANDTRYITFSVAKERIRLLHLAGRPTYDVRALRMWLKSDESVDVVAFFILRGDTDDPGATERELALIRFPVDELFTEHLASFDAIILQDIDAIRYKLAQYLVSLAGYVKHGGGLIMVGGPSSFAGGNYAGTPLDAILPVEQPRQGSPFDSADFVPSYTPAGMVAPVTHKVRSLLDGELPTMSGANMLGAPRPGAVVLWEHPKLRVGDRGMPVLALGEAGDGRAIALGVDSTHRLAFGQLAASASGRAYGALWDGLLGWLMRDPRYEAARVELVNECIEGLPTHFRIFRLPGMSGPVEIEVRPLSGKDSTAITQRVDDEHGSSVDLTVDGLRQGGYTAEVRIGEAPATRRDFGCERGGLAWADSRPDPDRLRVLAEASGGQAVAADDVASLPTAPLTEVVAERHVAPLLPVWAWTLAAALALGGHWLVRRQAGLT